MDNCLLKNKIFLNLKWIFMGDLKKILKKLKIKADILIWPIKNINNSPKKFAHFFIDKKGLRIGGKLHWKFEKMVNKSKILYDVNISKKYLGKENKVVFLCSADNLNFSKNEEYDFVSSSHLLEHLSNPIKAIKEWMRVLKKGGAIYCAIPHKKFTFDHYRKTITLKHLIQDYENKINGHDPSHVKEYIEKYDPDMDGGNKRKFLRDLYSNPLICTHYHVWTEKEILELFNYLNLKIMWITVRGNTIHILAIKD